MYTLKINGKVYSNVVDFEFLPRHGFTKITKKLSGAIHYEGYYNDKYFLVESARDYGITSWEVLQGDVEDEEKLFDWIQDHKQHKEDKVYQKWIDSIQ